MRINFSTLKTLITLVFFSTLFSCENNPLEIDVSAIELELKLKRFDQDLFRYPNGVTAQSVKELHQEYGLFFEDFTQSVISIGSPKNPNLFYQLNDFSNDPFIKEIKNDAAEIYADFSAYEAELNKAFKHYAFYFPTKKYPQLQPIFLVLIMPLLPMKVI